MAASEKAVKAAYDRGSQGVSDAAAANTKAVNAQTAADNAAAAATAAQTIANAAQSTANAALPKSGGNITGNLTVQSKNVVRSVNGANAGADGNVNISGIVVNRATSADILNGCSVNNDGQSGNVRQYTLPNYGTWAGVYLDQGGDSRMQGVAFYGAGGTTLTVGTRIRVFCVRVG